MRYGVAATRVGAEASVPFKDAYYWNSSVNFQPGNGETVSLNPPKFGWLFATNMPWVNYPEVIYEFQLQISTNSDFRDFVINLRTPYNFYNFLPPFPKGVTIYWRVGHINSETGTTNFVYPTRTFTVAPDAQTWDRSMLADQSYMASKAQHPYMLFNDSTKAGLYKFLTNAYTHREDNAMTNWVRGTGWQWFYTKYFADTAATNAWVTNYTSTNTLIDFATRCELLATLGYVWQLTGDKYYTNSNPMEQLYWTAQNFIDRDLWESDPVVSQDTFRLEDIAHAYDLFYPALTDRQRAKVRQAISMFCNYSYYGAYRNRTWRNIKDPTSWLNSVLNGTDYTAGYNCTQDCPQNIGTSHWHDQHYTAFRAGLAIYNEDKFGHLAMEFGLNYLINRATPFGDVAGVNQGRAYGMGGFGSIINAYVRSGIMFPEANLGRSPVLQNNALFWDYFVPVGYTPGNEPWGDSDYNGEFNQTWLRADWGRNFACISSNGIAWQHWLSAIGPFITSDSFAQQNHEATYRELSVPYFFPPPAPQTDTLTAAMFAADGWGFASSLPPNLTSGYTNGVGLIFQARPRGCEEGHSHNSDLSYQIWAYGANITDAGGAYGAPIAKVPQGHYTLLIDGFGPVQGEFQHNEPYAAKMIGFANGADLVYMAAEAVNAYPRKPNMPVWNSFLAEPYRSELQITPKLPYVQSVQRHIVMPRKKYFVMLDNLETSIPAKFTWLYHIYEPTLSLDTSNARFTYSAKSQSSGNNVTVYVAHIASPSGLTWTNMTGQNVYLNPITGTNYPGGDFSRSNVLWVSNASAATNWHFMTVIYPARWDMAAPQITRLDDYTVEVKNGSEDDIISFDAATQFPANIVIDLPALSGRQLTQRPASPGNLRLVSP